MAPTELVEMERSPESRALYTSAFRMLRAPKGDRGLLGYALSQRAA